MNKSALSFDVEGTRGRGERSLSAVAVDYGLRIPASLKFFLSDTIAMLAALLIAYGLHMALTGAGSATAGALGEPALVRHLLFLPLLVATFAFGGLYSRKAWEAGELRQVVLAIALIGFCDAVMVLTGDAQGSGIWMLALWPVAAVLVIGLRMFLRILPFGLRSAPQQVILVGSGITAEEFSAGLRESRSGAVHVVQTLPLQWLAGLGAGELAHRVQSISEHFGIPAQDIRIVVAPSSSEIELARRLIDSLSGRLCSFSLLLPYAGLARESLSLHTALGSDFVLADVNHKSHAIVGRAIKRFLDIVIAGVAIVALLPLFAIIAIRLRIEGTPVVFSQLRMGRNGRRFHCLKFRTMYPDAEAHLASYLADNPEARLEWERFQKLANDPRVTPFGAVLRATSLDELPQLFNVLAGDMSIVGPRPIVAPEVDGYGSDRAYYERPEFRHYNRCKPGITGLWQVSGRTSTTHDERIRLDVWYCRNWSLWLDALILLRTVRAVLTRSGA